MEQPVSAFVVYNGNKKKSPSQQRRNRKRKQVMPSITKPNPPAHYCNDPHRCLECNGIENPEDSVHHVMMLIAKEKKVKTRNTKRKVKKTSPKVRRNSNQIIENNLTDQINNGDDQIESDDTIIVSPATTTVNGEESSNDRDGHDFSPVNTDSSKEGFKMFTWMISPFDPNEFLESVWEKKPLHIKRSNDYYKDIISTPIIDKMLRKEYIEFTKNIDITSYKEGTRYTHNPEGRANPHIVWDYYLEGCSVRLLNPQTFLPKLRLLNVTMQEFFNSFVGCNAYLTPPDSQGFAPHFDDIEAFVLQVEGKKYWRIYAPRNTNEFLPRCSSENFSDKDIGKPIMEILLEAGDMLYFPRGYIHQGLTIKGEHSLHVTMSMYQKHSWADLFEKLLPLSLQHAINENVQLRRGLPFDIYDNFGLVNNGLQTPRRLEINNIIELLFDKVKQHLLMDAAVDQMAKNYQHDALPPLLTENEKAVTVFGDTDVMVENGKVINQVEINVTTEIRLLRKNILRLVYEEDCFKIFYHVENSLEYHGYEPTYFEIEESQLLAIETLIKRYPEYIPVGDLGLKEEYDCIEIAEILWGRGLIMTKYPLPNVDQD